MPYSGMPSYMYPGQQTMPSAGMPSQMDMTVPHPVLLEARQIAPNQIQLVYDRRADLASATNISNYWIQNNRDRVSDVANLGTITSVDDSRMRFDMTFRINATPGVQYTVLSCFVNEEERTGFVGENWGSMSKNTFIAR